MSNNTGDENFSAICYGADQSCLSAETEAVERVLMANEHAKVPKLVFLIDNKTAQTGLETIAKGGIYLPKYAFGRWECIDRLAGQQETESHWVPSHSKKQGWIHAVDCYGDGTKWRRRNAVADLLADQGRQIEEDRQGLLARAMERRKARGLARAFMERMVLGASRYVLDNGIMELWKKAFEGL